MRFRRVLTVVTLAAVAMSALTACHTKIGQAAAVGSDTLSDSALSDLVQPGARPYTDQSRAQVVPKLNALTTWVRNELITAAITAHGRPASANDLTAARVVVTQSGLPGQALKANRGFGYSAKFFELLDQQYALLVVLVERLAHTENAARAFSLLQSGQATSAFQSAVASVKVAVDISPRYGSWNRRALAVSSASQDPAAGAPNFVHFGKA